MDEFLTFLYSEYFELKQAEEAWLTNNAVPADKEGIYRERRQNDKKALAAAEERIRRYMRAGSFRFRGYQVVELKELRRMWVVRNHL